MQLSLLAEYSGSREAYRTPASRLRAGSAAVSPGSCPTGERRQLQREASAEALAMEYEQSAGSGYEEVQSFFCTALNASCALLGVSLSFLL